MAMYVLLHIISYHYSKVQWLWYIYFDRYNEKKVQYNECIKNEWLIIAVNYTEQLWKEIVWIYQINKLESRVS